MSPESLVVVFTLVGVAGGVVLTLIVRKDRR